MTELDDGVGVAAAVALHVLCPRDLARTVHLPVVADLPAPWPGLSVNQQGTLVVTFRWTRTDPVLGSASWACARAQVMVVSSLVVSGWLRARRRPVHTLVGDAVDAAESIQRRRGEGRLVCDVDVIKAIKRFAAGWIYKGSAAVACHGEREGKEEKSGYKEQTRWREERRGGAGRPA